MKKENINSEIIARTVRIILCLLAIFVGFNLSVGYLSRAEVIDGEIVGGEVVKEEYLVDFSFSGENANTITLNPEKFIQENIIWDYSLDKGVTWVQGYQMSKTLTLEEVALINQNDDILVRVRDIISFEEKTYTVDIKKDALPSDLYANDLENRVISTGENLEWRFSETEAWTRFSVSAPDLTGDKQIFVRVGAHDEFLASEAVVLTFTKDQVNDLRKYVSNKNLTINGVSSEDVVNVAGNLLDGNALTDWKTVPNDKLKSVVIGLRNAIYLSAIDLVPSKNILEGNLKDVKIYVSMDAVNWTLAKEVNGLANDELVKSIEINPIPTKYIRIEAVSTYGVNDIASLAMVNVFEDYSKRVVPTAKVMYDVCYLTNGNVTATLVDASTNINIISEGGNTHTFTENGEFTFTFTDILGTVGTVIAKVDWIDKVAPTAEIQYSYSGSWIKASLVNESEPIEILNNGGNRSYTFSKNGTFEFVYRDLAGNENRTTAVVNTLRTPTSSKPNKNQGSSVGGNKKPSTNTNTNSNNNSNDKNEDNKKDDENKKEEPKEKNSFEVDNIKVTLLNKKLDSSVSLKKDKLKLTKTLKAKVGKASEYFELYFAKGDERQNVEDNYKINIKLDQNKVFKDIYKVEGDKIISIEHKNISANEIQIEVDKLSSYIISYDKSESEENKSHVADYIIALLLAVLLMAVAVLVYKKSRA